MTYALIDLQTGAYMHSGYGDKTLAELKDSLLSYISIDYQKDSADWALIKSMPVEELASMWDFEIEKGDFKQEVIA
jgi:hypothetical protein